jgi:hypothetical protein
MDEPASIPKDKLESESPTKSVQIAGSVGDGGSNLTADVIGVEMHLNIFIVAGAIPGRKDPLFTMGQMTPDFISVIRSFQKHVVGSSSPDGRVDPNGVTIKYLNGPISARGGKVSPGKIAPPADVATARKRIAETAQRYLKEGGHFLIGAHGDMPGAANGHPMRPDYTKPATLLEWGHPLGLGPTVLGAWTRTGRHGMLGCMGRAGRHGAAGTSLPPGDPLLPLLDTYMESIVAMRDVGIPLTRWPGFKTYLAHAIAFSGATSFAAFDALCPKEAKASEVYPRRINPRGLIHLGESCAGRRHYDCIGFVNFVLSKVLSAKWKFDMEFYTRDSSTFKVTRFEDGSKSDVLSLAEEGDIVLKDVSESHCGICTTFSNRVVVTNCRSMSLGLINSELTAEWRFLARLRHV